MVRARRVGAAFFHVASDEAAQASNMYVAFPNLSGTMNNKLSIAYS